MVRWGVLGSVAAVLVLAGCDVPQPGSPVADPAAPRAIAKTPVSAAFAFGPDLSTVDPCSVIDVGKLSADLQASLEPTDAFDDCPVSVRQADGTKVDVNVGPLETAADQPSAQLTQVATLATGMKLYTDTPVNGFCDEYVTFADNLRLVVSANAATAGSQANVCPAAETMARNAADQIRVGSVRHVRYPPGSLGPLDPCTLVPDSALAAAGLRGVAPTPFPQHHECAWRPVDTNAGASLRVMFDVGTEPKVVDRTTDVRSTVAGRSSVTSKFTLSGTSALCYVATGLNKYGNTGRLELALVEVRTGAASTVDACNASTTVAGVVWPKLPNTG